MKVFFDHQIYVAQKFGGISRYFNELMLIEKEGIQVQKISPELFKFTHPVLKTDLFSRGVRYLKRRAGFEKKEEIKFPEEAVNLFLKNDYDVFHPTYYDPYFLELSNKPFVLTVHDMIHEIYKEYFPLSDPTSYQKRILSKHANQIIAVSHKTKEDLVEIFNVPKDKVHVIHHASDFDKVHPSRPEGVNDLKKYILYVGTRWGYKNFYYPVIGLSEILKADKELQILCTGHPYTKEELQFFEDLGIKNQMHHIYLKNDQELSWVYRHAALFIFPSLYEGFGFPLLEAFACKCPVISSSGGSLSEVGGNAALYFNPKNKLEIQDAANKVLYDSEVRKILIEKGLEQFKLYSWETCRTETIKVYKAAN